MNISAPCFFRHSAKGWFLGDTHLRSLGLTFLVDSLQRSVAISEMVDDKWIGTVYKCCPLDGGVIVKRKATTREIHNTAWGMKAGDEIIYLEGIGWFNDSSGAILSRIKNMRACVFEKTLGVNLTPQENGSYIVSKKK